MLTAGHNEAAIVTPLRLLGWPDSLCWIASEYGHLRQRVWLTSEDTTGSEHLHGSKEVRDVSSTDSIHSRGAIASPTLARLVC